jgi:hypothetical protein
MKSKVDSRLTQLPKKMVLPAIALALLFLFLPSLASAQTWVRIKNQWTGQYLFESGGKVVYGEPSAFDQTAQWSMASDGSGHYRFQNRNSGDYMNIEHQYGWVECDAGSLNWSSEKWNWVLQSGYVYRVQSIWQPTKFMNIQDLLGYDECNAIANTYASSWWSEEPVEGATPPFQEYEAENGNYTAGTLMEASTSVGVPAAECSGREGVSLTGDGQSVSWVAQKAANSIVVRLSVPDSTSGGGANYTLDLYINNVRIEAIPVTSVYSWLYAPLSNESKPVESPTGGVPMHMFDEVSLMLPSGTTINAGDTVKLQKDVSFGNSAAFYDINLIDLEEVPAPIAEPSGYISITDAAYGASTTSADNTAAIQAAVNYAEANDKGLYIPQGVFQQKNKVTVKGITVQGAGMWYSQLASAGVETEGVTGAGFSFQGSNTTLTDFAVFGNVTDRWYADGNGAPPAINGSCGSGSTINDLWIEHSCIGISMGGGTVPPTGLVISNCRLRDLSADGIHLYGGTNTTTIENTTVRTSGDDGLNFDSTTAVSNSTFLNCTVQLPWRAACYADYGGYGNTFANCEAYDPLVFPGLTVDAGFSSTTFGPTATTFENMNLYRCGGIWNTNAYGALWVQASTSNIPSTANINIDGVNIYNPPNSGINIDCTSPYTQAGVTFNGINIDNAGTYGIYVDSTVNGSGTFDNVSIYNPVSGGLDNTAGAGGVDYTITKSGDVGW